MAIHGRSAECSMLTATGALPARIGRYQTKRMVAVAA